MMYAIKVADLAHEDVLLPARLLLTPVAPNRTTVVAEKRRLDGDDLVLDACPAGRADAIITILRTKRPSLRAYKQTTKNGRWKKI
jgi:hypothetical protein